MQPDTLLETLRLVLSKPHQRPLAQRLNFSVGKTNYILKALVEKGFVKVERFAQSENKLNYCYVLTPKKISEHISLTEKFIEIKQKNINSLAKSWRQLDQLIPTHEFSRRYLLCKKS